MVFLDKRIQVICDELKKQAVRQTHTLSGWQKKHGSYLRPEDADAAPEKYEPFDSLKDHWYGPDEHDWFTARAEVPQSFEGRPLWLHVRTQIEEWDDAKNPQFLLFADGEIVQGVDMNHRDVLLSTSAKAGHMYRLDLQAYTGTLHSEFRLIVEFREIDPVLNGLYWDLQVPLQAFPRLGAQSSARHQIEETLNNAVNMLDLRDPRSPEYLKTAGKAREYLKENLYKRLGGHKDVIASCIGHTHIDVAWWWTVAQTREKVARSFATVLKLMDEYPHYRFMSSQPQLYAFLKERYPELYARVKRRAAEGRWETEGGMWLEADCNLTSGESLVRQFMHGKKFFREEFGNDNRILWLPDVFGYSGALPQIMKLCGIDYFMTTKLSWNQFNKHPFDTFMWRGIDGTEVLTHLISTLGVGQDVKNFFTTYNGMLHPDALLGAWERYQQKDLNNDVLVSYGYGDGGGGPTRAMLETSDRMEHGVMGLPKVRQVFARDYFDELSARVSNHKRLPVWEGELYFEYHRGTLTSMARNKRANRKSEIALMNLEWLSSLASSRVPYPEKELDRLWKGVLLNQFHDILPGTCIHEVYEVTKREYAQIAEEISALARRRLDALTPASDGVRVYNPKGFASDETVSLGTLDAQALRDGEGREYPVEQTENGALAHLTNLPAKGWRDYAVVKQATAPASPFLITDKGIETPHYVAEFDENGLLSRLYDKECRREVLKSGEKGNLLKVYEDKPIYYDNWDIDIYYTEKSWDVTNLAAMKWTEKGALRATLDIERTFSNSTIKQRVRFYANSRRIDFETTVDWHEHQHLMKVHFPVDVHSDEATFDIQFGNVRRKVHQNTSWDVARFESCGQKWMDFSEGHYGVSLLNDCKYGHSVKNGVIALTLIKSGTEPNPVTDQEEHVFTYALYPHKEGWQEGRTAEEAYALNQPAFAVPGGRETGEFSLARVSRRNVMLETVKRAENGNGFIVRMYEFENARTEAVLHWGFPILSCEEVNALEETVQAATPAGNDIPFVIKPYEIKTFRIVSDIK